MSELGTPEVVAATPAGQESGFIPAQNAKFAEGQAKIAERQAQEAQRLEARKTPAEFPAAAQVAEAVSPQAVPQNIDIAAASNNMDALIRDAMASREPKVEPVLAAETAQEAPVKKELSEAAARIQRSLVNNLGLFVEGKKANTAVVRNEGKMTLTDSGKDKKDTITRLISKDAGNYDDFRDGVAAARATIQKNIDSARRAARKQATQFAKAFGQELDKDTINKAARELASSGAQEATAQLAILNQISKERYASERRLQATERQAEVLQVKKEATDIQLDAYTRKMQREGVVLPTTKARIAEKFARDVVAGRYVSEAVAEQSSKIDMLMRDAIQDRAAQEPIVQKAADVVVEAAAPLSVQAQIDQEIQRMETSNASMRSDLPEAVRNGIIEQMSMNEPGKPNVVEQLNPPKIAEVAAIETVSPEDQSETLIAKIGLRVEGLKGKLSRFGKLKIGPQSPPLHNPAFRRIGYATTGAILVGTAFLAGQDAAPSSMDTGTMDNTDSSHTLVVDQAGFGEQNNWLGAPGAAQVRAVEGPVAPKEVQAITGTVQSGEGLTQIVSRIEGIDSEDPKLFDRALALATENRATWESENPDFYKKLDELTSQGQKLDSAEIKQLLHDVGGDNYKFMTHPDQSFSFTPQAQS